MLLHRKGEEFQEFRDSTARFTCFGWGKRGKPSPATLKDSSNTICLFKRQSDESMAAQVK